MDVEGLVAGQGASRERGCCKDKTATPFLKIHCKKNLGILQPCNGDMHPKLNFAASTKETGWEGCTQGDSESRSLFLEGQMELLHWLRSEILYLLTEELILGGLEELDLGKALQ